MIIDHRDLSSDRRGMDLFRAVVEANEMSERVLVLTFLILRFNPSHYPVW